eukprot:TRINITY_DN1255_c0_g1_i2.p1 TRINITY_DN1255_c0_g1~~TRINITY_DN1255_c0_g1_i2.p1  ORF type:complete len:471 (+),score=104.73 TRINITY_DN1255_c0_g1_i2:209-1414(+)
MGSHVAKTIQKGVVETHHFEGEEGRVLFITAMFAALAGAGVWVLIATRYGLPVSTTHAIVGGVAGTAIAAEGYGAVQWKEMALIVASWLCSPILAGVIALFFYVIVNKIVLKHSNPAQQALNLLPILFGVTGMIICLFVVYKGSPALKLSDIGIGVALGISAGVGVLVSLLMWLVVRYVLRSRILPINALLGEIEAEESRENESSVSEQEMASPTEEKECDEMKHADTQSELAFSYLQVCTASFESFAHGANDVANAIGPFAGMVAALDGEVHDEKIPIPLWVLALGGIAIVVGLATWGYRVMQTIGTKLIAKVTPSRGFTIELGTTFTVLLGSRAGIPLSTTHCSVGAVVGVGMADGVRSISWRVIWSIVQSWLLTVPAGAIITVAIFSFLRPIVDPERF